MVLRAYVLSIPLFLSSRPSLRSCQIPSRNFPRRSFSHQSTGARSMHHAPVSLPYDLLHLGAAPASHSDKASPSLSIDLLFFHCLLGGRWEWFRFHSSFLHALHSEFVSSSKSTHHFPISARCYLFDLRNHFLAPSSPSHSLADLSGDIENLLKLHGNSNGNRRKIFAIGHSQGGKALLLHALTSSLRPSPLDGIISLDAAPAAYDHSHSSLFTAMTSLQSHTHYRPPSAFHRKSNVSTSVEKTIKAELLRTIEQVGKNYRMHRMEIDFLLDAAYVYGEEKRSEGDSRGPWADDLQDYYWSWRCHLDVLHSHESFIHGWALASDSPASSPSAPSLSSSSPSPSSLPWHPFEGPSLFLGASRSARLRRLKYIQRLEEYFPHRELTILEGNHFIHHDQPKQTAKFIADFVRKNG